MKTFIVFEICENSHTIHRTWVCKSKESAEKCLKMRYDVACAFNGMSNLKQPTDCLEYGFFYWDLSNGMRMSYRIEESKMFDED